MAKNVIRRRISVTRSSTGQDVASSKAVFATVARMNLYRSTDC